MTATVSDWLPRTSAVASLTAVLATGCVLPIPSGYEGTSRQNLPEMVPSFIRTLETTREDVILRLGEPDAAAFDESWISFGSAYCTGGALFVMAAGGNAGGAGAMGMRYFRLIVPFDLNGFVTQPIFESKSCVEYVGFAGNQSGSSTPCLDIKRADIHEKY